MSRFHTPILPATLKPFALKNQEFGFGPTGDGRCGDLYLSGKLFCGYEDKYGGEEVKVFFPDGFDRDTIPQQCRLLADTLSKQGLLEVYTKRHDVKNHIELVTFIVNTFDAAKDWASTTKKELSRGLYVGTVFDGAIFQMLGSKFKHPLSTIAASGNVDAIQELYDELCNRLVDGEAFFNTPEQLRALGVVIDGDQSAQQQ